MIVLVGASASGKSTVEKYLIKHYRFSKIVPYTTRPIRDGEENGVDYNFVSIEEFNEMDKPFVFAEKAEFNNWKYGTKSEDYLGNDKIAILTPSGYRKVKSKIKNVFCVYIDTPRRERMYRLLNRGDNIDEAYRRNLSDVGQFDGFEAEADYVYKYNPLDGVEDISKIIFSEYRKKMAYRG